ncbi:MAG: ABC transporter substrate-binding protein [Planctomycetota bacterium]
MSGDSVAVLVWGFALAAVMALGGAILLRTPRAPPASDHVAPARASRMVVFNTGAVDILAQLGCLDKVVGVSHRCYVPGTESKVRVENDGGAGTANVEALLALRPDMVIVEDNFRDCLEPLGVPVRWLPLDSRFEDVLRWTREIGGIAGDASGGESLAREWSQRADTLRRRTAALRPVRVYFEYRGPGETIGRGTVVDDMIELAGGQNIAGEIDAPRPRLTAEVIVAADPEVIVLSPWAETEEQAAARPGWQTVSAIRTGRIHRLTFEDRAVMLFTPRCVAGAERHFLPWFHPELSASAGRSE